MKETNKSYFICPAEDKEEEQDDNFPGEDDSVDEETSDANEGNNLGRSRLC